MSEIKSDIKDIKVESIATIRSNREDVEKNVAEMNRQVSDQIPIIKGSAEELAMSTVRQTINEQFETNNIRALVAQAADEKLKSQVGDILDGKIKEASKDIEEQSKAIATLSLAVDQIRVGDQRWFMTVDSMSKTHHLTIIRELAGTLLKQKLYDYQQAYAPYSPDDSLIVMPRFGKGVRLKKDADEVVRFLIEEINNIKDLNTLAPAFNSINHLTGEHFEMFDIPSVNAWFKNKYTAKKEEIERRALEKHFIYLW